MRNSHIAVALFSLLFYFSSIAHTTHYSYSTGNDTNGELQSGSVITTSGLIFEKEFKYRLEDNSYTDIIQLHALNDTAQAIQFRLLVNEAVDDSTILIFQNIKKGNDVSDSNWVLIYNVFRGDTNAIGASKDKIYVLLYNLNQAGGLEPGDYNDLLEVEYRVADLPIIEDSIKSSMKITNAEATTSQGFPIDITPSRDEFKILVRRSIDINTYGLIFEQDTVYRLEEDFYTDIMRMKNLSSKIQALQFRLIINKAVDDKVILTFQNIQKGSDVSDPSWALDYNVFRGPLTVNGASKDEIYVLLYNLNQDGGLIPGDYEELLKVNYRVADLPALQDSLKSSIKISNAEATTYQGFPVDITPSRDELIIIARNRVGFYGDVNGDGCLDILDLTMVVNHIVGKDSLESDEFERADIAPWVYGNSTPDPDGLVNVQDLSLLHSTILTGVYPDGTPIIICSYNMVSKLNGEADSKVIIYIYNEGITIYLDTKIDLCAAQIEFGNVNDDPENMIINTDIGEGYYKRIDKMLRILLYDRQAEKVLKAGEKILAEIPFYISRPEDITIEKLIFEDTNGQRIIDNQVEIIYEYPPSLSQNYKTYQNYPNPFNPATTIQYFIPKRSNVTLKVYDILCNEIVTLVNEEKPRGDYSVNFNASGLASGVYFYRITAGEFRETKKMILMK